MFLYKRDRTVIVTEWDDKTHLICLNGETKEIGYWRKANAIHRWFVENVQNGEDDCRDYFVTKEQLTELLNLVNQVLADPPLSPPTRVVLIFLINKRGIEFEK